MSECPWMSHCLPHLLGAHAFWQGLVFCKYFNFILPLREPRLHSLDPDPIWTRVKFFQGHPFWLHTFYSLSWLAALHFPWLRIRAWIIGSVALHFRKGVVGEFRPSEEFTYVIPVPQDRSVNTCELQQPSTKAINSRTKPWICKVCCEIWQHSLEKNGGTECKFKASVCDVSFCPGAHQQHTSYFKLCGIPL